MKSEPNIADPDAFYAAWVAAHEGLSDVSAAAQYYDAHDWCAKRPASEMTFSR